MENSSCTPQMWFLHLLSSAESEKGVFREILQGNLDFQSEPWPGISKSAKDLIRKMLDRNPKKRITAPEVLCKFLFTRVVVLSKVTC